jgi:hypothetical protein
MADASSSFWSALSRMVKPIDNNYQSSYDNTATSSSDIKVLEPTKNCLPIDEFNRKIKVFLK